MIIEATKHKQTVNNKVFRQLIEKQLLANDDIDRRTIIYKTKNYIIKIFKNMYLKIENKKL